MEFIPAFIKGLYTIHLQKREDERGLFARTFCKNEFQRIGFNKEFVQFNHSYNKFKGTVRGMHYQKAPFAETKLIRCIQGAIYDVAVDLREDSPTFLQHFSIELNAENMQSILIPEGFAHGFQTLTDDATIIYHHTAFYEPDAENGFLFNDPQLNIEWKLKPVNLSEKDKNYKLIDQNFKGIKNDLQAL